MVIGITGGIGSGKSYVAKTLADHFGIPVYDCDREAKRLNVESEKIREALTQQVGPEVYAADGSLCRQVLAQYLFHSEENAQRINAIIHPEVANDFRKWAEGQELVALESAILFESGFDSLADFTVNVSAPAELCLARAAKRDKTTTEAIARRANLQAKDEERSAKADYTLINDGRDILPQLADVLMLAKRKEKK